MDDTDLPARREVYDAIRQWWEERGIPPTYADLARITNRGETTIRYHIDNLKALGYVDQDYGIRRSIRLTQKIWEK